MSQFRCMNHPERGATVQCSRCGKPLCHECFDGLYGCAANCGKLKNGPARSGWLRILMYVGLALFIIPGALSLLLLAICAGSFMFY